MTDENDARKEEVTKTTIALIDYFATNNIHPRVAFEAMLCILATQFAQLPSNIFTYYINKFARLIALGREEVALEDAEEFLSKLLKRKEN